MNLHKVCQEGGMSFQRRQLLQILPYVLGSSFILRRNEFAMAAQNSAQPGSPAPPAKEAAKHESGGTEMEKVAGIGGLFFRADCPIPGGAPFSLLNLRPQPRIQIVVPIRLLQSRKCRLTCAMSRSNPLHLPLRL